ncbi:MAG: O-acetylhomoserine aminocarboxypropyltransferase/cysteine synthase, partial [Bifidobacterium mongoliense]|nr:O-acetylhomoserine aminocarboxypropyltransferase/cysteine synthase [Bifidobacterium mongoliense]
SYVFHDFDHAAARFGLADPGNIYGRLTNSTQGVFEDRIAALEAGTAALAVASGAAAVEYAVRNITQSGDHIVSAKTIYGGTFNLFKHTLPRDGIATTFVDPSDPKNFEDAIQENTKLVYFETFGNPNADLVDFEAVADIAHRHHLPVIVDNTFATPYLFRPLEHGADVVVESATKFIGGHGTTLGGVVIEGGTFDWAEVPGKFPTLTEADPSYHGLNFYGALGPTAYVTRIRAILLRDTGATISPFAAFLLLQGTETLSLRVERHVENALKVIDYLKTVPEVDSISHPSIEGRSDHELYQRYFPKGGGSIFTFEIKGGKAAARVFINNLHLFSLLANVADVKSLVIHPASTTHSQESPEELEDQGIHEGTIRLSIGTEHIDDIIADLTAGFEAVRAAARS